jgi:aspartyl-tRNA(Asn)/glutamyl-tRNA(Gln) amidotransferase subunit C
MDKNIIEISDVEHVAKLSRLEFSDEELIKTQKDSAGIVEHFSVLSSVDTSSVSEINDEVGAQRADIECEGLTKDEVIKNAPLHNNSAFIVPRVVE